MAQGIISIHPNMDMFAIAKSITDDYRSDVNVYLGNAQFKPISNKMRASRVLKMHFSEDGEKLFVLSNYTSLSLHTFCVDNKKLKECAPFDTNQDRLYHKYQYVQSPNKRFIVDTESKDMAVYDLLADEYITSIPVDVGSELQSDLINSSFIDFSIDSKWLVIKGKLDGKHGFAILKLPETTLSTPSFDCSKAHTQVEKTICSDKELSLLDAKLATDYKIVGDKIGDDRIEFTNEQRAWLKQRNTCTSTECLTKTYFQRIDSLCRQYPEQLSNKPM